MTTQPTIPTLTSTDVENQSINYGDDLIEPFPCGGPKSEKSNGGKYENSVGRTNRRTDGAGYIGPFPLRRGGSNKATQMKDPSEDTTFYTK